MSEFTERENIYRAHNIKMLDDLRPGDMFLRESPHRPAQIYEVHSIDMGSGDYSDFTVYYYDNTGDILPIHNLIHVKVNISKQLRELEAC